MPSTLLNTCWKKMCGWVEIPVFCVICCFLFQLSNLMGFQGIIPILLLSFIIFINISLFEHILFYWLSPSVEYELHQANGAIFLFILYLPFLDLYLLSKYLLKRKWWNEWIFQWRTLESQILYSQFLRLLFPLLTLFLNLMILSTVSPLGERNSMAREEQKLVGNLQKAPLTWWCGTLCEWLGSLSPRTPATPCPFFCFSFSCS